ncbi:SDR family oxidoreductase [Puniceicoccaceae bacterium K14]|nr:SDR family oxidoreductase [Puniceicoccaceae bacterium K14]
MSIKIENQIAFVTGSNRGIGRGFVQELLNRGASKVYATARNTESLSELASQNPGRVVLLNLDVTDEKQVAEAVGAAQDVTLLINNAGALGGEDLFTGDIAKARLEFEVNYWGVLYLTRAFAPILKSNGGGGIITLSSVAGLTSFPLIPTYSDSKAAIHSLIAGIRFLLAEQNTFVAGVYPGPIDTDMAKGMEMEKATVEAAVNKVFDDVENGVEDVFTDAFADNYKEAYFAGQKTLEKMVTGMLQPA